MCEYFHISPIIIRSHSCPNNVLHWPHMMLHTNVWTDCNAAYMGTSGIATGNTCYGFDIHCQHHCIEHNNALYHGSWSMTETYNANAWAHDHGVYLNRWRWWPWYSWTDPLLPEHENKEMMLPHAVGCRNNNWWVWEIKDYRYRYLLSRSTIKEEKRRISTKQEQEIGVDKLQIMQFVHTTPGT